MMNVYTYAPNKVTTNLAINVAGSDGPLETITITPRLWLHVAEPSSIIPYRVRVHQL